MEPHCLFFHTLLRKMLFLVYKRLISIVQCAVITLYYLYLFSQGGPIEELQRWINHKRCQIYHVARVECDSE